MQFYFSFKQMDTSPALQDYAEQKLREKIQKFVTKPIEAQVFFSVVRHEHTVHCSLKAGDGFSIDVEHSCGDMYGSIDHIADKLEVQLRRQKEKLKDHKLHRRHGKPTFVVVDEAEEESAVDAADILKYEEARRKVASGK